MDQSKKRKAPPVPRFQEQQVKQTTQKKQQLQSKLNQFLTSLSKPTQIQPSEIEKPKDQKIVKKSSLANLNSKLNSMLNSKKINLNSMEAPGNQNQQKANTNNNNNKLAAQILQKPKKQIDIEYDPRNPNDYEHCKSQYISFFQSLTSEKMGNQVQNDRIQEVQQVKEDQLQKKEELALRMMLRLGYKVGQGLGKNNQGIKTPLTVKKTTDSSCIIEPSSISLQQLISPEVSARNSLEAFGVLISRVVVINGIVKLRQLTDQIENQIKEQCRNHGNIANWIIYQPPEGQDLRIFIEFESKEQAFQAFLRLNNLYFYESQVSIRFYNEESFRNSHLDDRLHQHINC